MKIKIVLLVLVLSIIACGTVEAPKSQVATDLLVKATVPLPVEVVPDLNSEGAKMNYLNVQVEWASDCADQLDIFSKTFSAFENTTDWTTAAIRAIDSVERFCVNTSSYKDVPTMFIDVNSEKILAQEDFAKAMRYTREFVIDKGNLLSGELGIAYIEDATAHINNMTAMLVKLK